MPADSQYFLSIDNGTQSIRAIVFDQSGNLVAKSKVDLDPYISERDGWAEQHADYFWGVLCEACQKLWPLLEIPRSAIKAVSVTTQRATVLPLGDQERPLRRCISWLDQRQVDTKPSLKPLESLLMSAVGAKHTAVHFHQQAEANWIAQQEPQVWRDTQRFVFLSGYHVTRLTGARTDAVASQVGYVPFDFKQQAWAEDNSWLWRALPIKRSMLPGLVKAGQKLGAITPRASEETGIPAGLPLIASGSDKACEVLGSGVLDATTGSLSYGTTATFNITSDRYQEAIPFHPPYPGVVPGTYNVEMFVPRGYWMVSWFKREFGLPELLKSRDSGVAPEVLFDDLLRAVPPGSLGLMLQPYWSAGMADKGPEAKGAIIGFGDVHTRAHLYRALIEGLTYALREAKELLEKRSGTHLRRLRVSGGGSQSDEVMQISADVFGMSVERPHTYETSGLGAAIAAAVGVGAYPDFQTAVEQMVRRGDCFEPNEQHRDIYDQLYKTVYCKMYKRLQPSYQAIRKVTGYP